MGRMRFNVILSICDESECNQIGSEDQFLPVIECEPPIAEF